MKVSERMKQFIFLICLWASAIIPAQAQEIQARVLIDTAHVLIGDQFNLKIELDQAKNMKVQFPQIGDTLSSTIEVISRSPLDTFHLEKDEQIKIIQNLTITSFDTGKQIIPSFHFDLKMNKLAQTIETQPVEFFVHTMPIDTTKGPVDIKKPYGAPVTLKEVSPYILGIMLLGALLFFLFYYLHRRKHNKPVFGKFSKPKEPPHIIAIRMLDRIKDQKLWQHNQVKTYYSDISDTLRIYIEDRFGIQAMEFTTEEILNSFVEKKALIPDKSFNDLKSILSLADLVKFAKYEPLPDDHNLTLMNAYFFVNDTKQEENKMNQPQGDDREGEEVDLK
jgi:hypothetical protein